MAAAPSPRRLVSFVLPTRMRRRGCVTGGRSLTARMASVTLRRLHHPRRHRHRPRRRRRIQAGATGCHLPQVRAVVSRWRDRSQHERWRRLSVHGQGRAPGAPGSCTWSWTAKRTKYVADLKETHTGSLSAWITKAWHGRYEHLRWTMRYQYAPPPRQWAHRFTYHVIRMHLSRKQGDCRRRRTRVRVAVGANDRPDHNLGNESIKSAHTRKWTLSV